MKLSLSRLAALGFMALILVVPMGSIALAHAAYKDSNPADESRVEQAPNEIWAEYTESPSDGSYLRVFDPCGEQVDNADSRPEGYRLYITLAGERAGTYRVEWFVDSAVDNHPTRGTFTFTVASGERCPGVEQPREKEEPRERRDNDEPSQPETSVDRENGADSGDPAADGGGEKGAGRHDQHKQGGADRDSRDKRDTEVVAAPNDPPSGENAPEEPGLLSDIPIGGLVIALGMAAAIGAAGGFIYAGIMGYHRVSH